MKFPPSGSFEDFTLHELAIHMIMSRYSGSIEIDYPDNLLRIFQFDKGNLCAASSNAENEQLDSIIRADRDPQLSAEQKKYLQERLDAGMKYGKALVETALMSAAELLTYNSKQASAIFGGALCEQPLGYKTQSDNADKYRPLPIDPYMIIRKSILADVDAGIVQEMLGDENTAYMKSDDISGGSKSFQEDEEVRAILSHLDGRRSIREIAARIGLNPDRTSRMLLMLKMMGWIEPAVGGDEQGFIESPDRLVAAPPAEPASGGEDHVEDNAEILQLLGTEDTQVDIDAPVDGLPPLDNSDTVDLSSGTMAPPQVEEPVQAPQKQEPAPFKGVLEERENRAGGGKLLKIALPLAVAFIVVAVVSAGLLIGSSKPAASEENDLSFYPPEVEEEQLPLDKEFTEAGETANDPLRIDLDNNKQKQETDKPQANKPAAVRENIEESASPTPEPKEKSPEEKPQPVEARESKTEKKPATQDKASQTNTRPQDTRTEQSKASNAQQRGEIRSWDEVQPQALDSGFRGNWNEAVQLWAPPLSTTNADAYTLLIRRTNKQSDVSSVFERFANSARMRNEFFVVKRGGTFFVCWGFFPESAAAQKALGELPTRVSQYRPALRRLGDITSR